MNTNGDEEMDIVMQARCVYCKHEQYALNVFYVSTGQGGCAFCGHKPRVYRVLDEYRADLRNPHYGGRR